MFSEGFWCRASTECRNATSSGLNEISCTKSDNGAKQVGACAYSSRAVGRRHDERSAHDLQCDAQSVPAREKQNVNQILPRKRPQSRQNGSVHCNRVDAIRGSGDQPQEILSHHESNSKINRRRGSPCLRSDDVVNGLRIHEGRCTESQASPSMDTECKCRSIRWTSSLRRRHDRQLHDDLPAICTTPSPSCSSGYLTEKSRRIYSCAGATTRGGTKSFCASLNSDKARVRNNDLGTSSSQSSRRTRSGHSSYVAEEYTGYHSHEETPGLPQRSLRFPIHSFFKRMTFELRLNNHENTATAAGGTCGEMIVVKNHLNRRRSDQIHERRNRQSRGETTRYRNSTSRSFAFAGGSAKRGFRTDASGAKRASRHNGGKNAGKKPDITRRRIRTNADSQQLLDIYSIIAEPSLASAYFLRDCVSFFSCFWKRTNAKRIKPRRNILLSIIHLVACFKILALHMLLGGAWHSIPGSNESNIFYTFQEFYTDAQYGPDFGYYSKGRILQGEFFNSYTTFPMGLSPWFGNLIADRLYATWLAMQKPDRFNIFEFGGGTGVLARDILLRIVDKYPMMIPHARYTLGERAAGLRRQQKKTVANANISESSTMFRVAEADAREASRLKKPGDSFVGAVISNELLDEFDPVKLKLVWQTGNPPNPSEVRSCRSWREVYVMHRVERSLLLNSNWQREASAIVCAYLDDPWIARLIGMKFQHERRCYPYAVCCVPMLLALNKMLHYDHLFLERLEYRNFDFFLEEYERQVADSRALVTKEQYRMIRRAHLNDYQMEEDLLTGNKIATDQVAMLLTEERCTELTAFFARHALRFSRAAERRDAIDRTAPLSEISTSSFLKWVVRPGEEEFARETSLLLDRGISISIDYGADFEALAWLQIVKPNYEGIHIMDARHGNLCTNKGELQCPGMHDITTNVDFTNFAESARDFKVISYAPMAEMERSFGFGARQQSLFPHVIEQAGGIRSAGIWGWYSTKNTEPWASFKLLVMQKGELALNPFHGMAQFPLLRARDEVDHCMEDTLLPSLAGALLRESKLRLNSVEPWATAHVLARLNPDLVYDQELDRQRAVMNEYHLSILLLDYAAHLSEGSCPIRWDEEQMREIADARLLRQVFGEAALERALRYYVQVNNMTVVKPSYGAKFSPVGCMLRKGLLSYCGRSEVLDEGYKDDLEVDTRELE
ncbi:unnamed protein product [Amoebophrya sp. A25]|nr:unnamed protein product [Amoebophrya sp. A25]|eukprot:GSA25T00007736001.1